LPGLSPGAFAVFNSILRIQNECSMQSNVTGGTVQHTQGALLSTSNSDFDSMNF
jgi:hypothetical protein